MVKKETGMNSMIRVLAVLLLAVGSLSAADRPNLSGTWKANLDKSDYGPVPPPTSFTRTVTHAEPSISFLDLQETAIGPQRTERKYSTDGKEIAFDGNGAEVKSAATWEGSKLVVRSRVDDASLKIVETITPAADGKSFESMVHIASPQGDLDIKVVFEKK